MDFGELVYRLKNVIPPIAVKLGHISQWTLVQRLQARDWLETSGPMPEFLKPFVADAATESPKAPTRVGVAPPTQPAIVETIAGIPGTREEAIRANIPLPKPEVPLFATANKGPGITPDYARIIESVYAVDAFKDYTDLETNLEVGEQRGDYHTLREHLDKAEQRARRAHRLYLGAQLERSNWERDAEVTSAAMRSEAHAELEAEKEAGERKKMITDADVTSRVAEKFPDEWRAQETMRRKLKGVESTIEHLTERWNSKCSSLRTLLETLRK